MSGGLFFTADDGVHGVELSQPRNLTDVDGMLFFSTGGGFWRSDGTEAGTVFVTGLEPSGFFSNEVADVAGTLFWSADDGIRGAELWALSLGP